LADIGTNDTPRDLNDATVAKMSSQAKAMCWTATPPEALAVRAVRVIRCSRC
jgi:hypothetical protein